METERGRQQRREERDQRRAISRAKSLGGKSDHLSLHCTAPVRPAPVVRKTIHTPTPQISLAGCRLLCGNPHYLPPTSEPRFELEAVSIEGRPVLDKSICRAEAVAARKCWPNGGVLKRSITFSSLQCPGLSSVPSGAQAPRPSFPSTHRQCRRERGLQGVRASGDSPALSPAWLRQDGSRQQVRRAVSVWEAPCCLLAARPARLSQAADL